MKIFLLVLVVGVAGFYAYPHLLPAPPGPDPYLVFLAPEKACAGQTLTGLSLARKEKVLVCMIGYARREHGLRRLRVNPILTKAAASKLSDVVRCGVFGHTPCGADFQALYRKLGYDRGHGSAGNGENLGWGSDVYANPRSIVDGWLNSREHREALFSTLWRELGVSVVDVPSFLGHQNVELGAAEFGFRNHA